MTKIIVTNYELQEGQIIAHISDGKCDCTYEINRPAFEHWLTGGSGIVDMGFTHSLHGVITEVELLEPISDYWMQGTEINNTPILEHLQLYVGRDELARCEAKAAILEQHLKDLIEWMDGISRQEALVTLAEYGMIKQETGEHIAKAMWKQILLSNEV